MGWKIAYVILCLAGMAAFYAGLHWIWGQISADMGAGIGLGIMVGGGVMYLANKYDQRASDVGRNTVGRDRTPNWPKNPAP